MTCVRREWARRCSGALPRTSPSSRRIGPHPLTGPPPGPLSTMWRGGVNATGADAWPYGVPFGAMMDEMLVPTSLTPWPPLHMLEKGV